MGPHITGTDYQDYAGDKNRPDAKAIAQDLGYKLAYRTGIRPTKLTMPIIPSVASAMPNSSYFKSVERSDINLGKTITPEKIF